MKNNLLKNETGFTLFISLIIASVIMIIGVSLHNLVVKELLFSFSGRESEKAFFAADSGIECGLYWDKNGNFNVSPYTINCAGLEITNPMNASSTTFDLNFLNGACSRVIVEKGIPEILPYTTRITSRGYNVSCNDASSRRVERGLRSSY